MKWFSIVSLFISLSLGGFSSAYPADYEGLTVQDVQVTCLTAPEMIKLVQRNITIQPGDPFSSEKIRASIRKIYALKGFAQITVDAEAVAGGVRLTFCPVQIKTIAKIQITGNKAVATGKIQNALGVNPGERIGPAAMSELQQRVVKLYQDQGYHQIQLTFQTIEQPGFEQATLALDIQEGELAKIETIVFNGQTVFSNKELVQASQLTPGTRFSQEVLEKGLGRVKKRYAAKGYLSMEIFEPDVQYHETTNAVALRLTVNEGKPTDIRFEGNASFSAAKLQALLQIFTGENLREDVLAENVAVLNKYYQAKGFPFVKVTLRTLTENDRPVLLFVIEEGPQVRVQQIVITGNQAFSAKQLRGLMFTDTTGLFSKGRYQETVLQEDLLAIKTFYHQNGYLEAEVASVAKEFSEDRSQVTITLRMQEGIQTQIADIHLSGETDEIVLKKIRKLLLLKNGVPLDINKVKQSVELLKEFYASQGYIQVAVEVAPVFTSEHRYVTLTFRITPGKKFYIGKISIEGVFRTKEVFIRRELRVQEGDVYNPEKIRETVRRLNQTGLYESVAFRRLDPKSEDPIQNMQLAVVETSAKDVKFAFGYSTERGLKGAVEYTDKNVFNFGGRGSVQAELSLDPKKFTLNQPKLTLQYQQPHFFTQDTNLMASLYDDIQKDNASFDVERRGGRLAVRHNFTNTLSASLGYYAERAEPSNVSQDAILSPRDTKILTIGGLDTFLTWDRRDDVIQPKQGVFTQLYFRTANTTLGSESDFFEVNAQVNWYLPLFRNYGLAGSLNGKLIEPATDSQIIPIYNRYFLGGENTIRGFPKDSIGPTKTDVKGNPVYIGGDRLLRANVELRFPIYSALGGVFFYDTGANWLNRDGLTAADIRKAIGLGLRIATPVGPLRLDYGWKLDRRAGESAGDYYITIGSAF